MGTQIGNTAKELGLVAGSAILTYFALGIGIFEPGYDHIEQAVAA